MYHVVSGLQHAIIVLKFIYSYTSQLYTILWRHVVDSVVVCLMQRIMDGCVINVMCDFGCVIINILGHLFDVCYSCGRIVHDLNYFYWMALFTINLFLNQRMKHWLVRVNSSNSLCNKCVIDYCSFVYVPKIWANWDRHINVILKKLVVIHVRPNNECWHNIYINQFKTFIIRSNASIKNCKINYISLKRV